MKIMLLDTPADPLRLAFPHLVDKREPMAGSDGKAKFEATLIITPGGDNARKVEEAIVAVCKEKYGAEWKDHYAEFADDQKGLRKGNLKRDKSDNIYDGFEGNLYVVAKNENRPGVFSRSATPVVGGDEGFPYGGCYVNAEVDFWALKKQGVKKRVVVDLLGVQFSRDGDSFGAGSAPSKATAFANLSAADDSAPKSGGLLD